MTPADLRALLGRTYYPFYGRHGRPRRIQLSSAALLTAGGDVLLVAPSASGKTEAYAAPLCERLLTEGWNSPAVLVVSPTRALANDLARRLQEPLAQLGVSLGRWTGEHKEPAAGVLPAVTILTPESLDARLSREPAALRSVRCAVLDELHVLDGGVRGDQLRILIARLRRLTAALQVVAASATVSDPEATASRYLRDATIVCDAVRPAIRARIVCGVSAAIVGREVEALARAGGRKFLIFANARRQVEELAPALRSRPALRGVVYAHHGSLSRSSRERTEAGFLQAPRAVCVATMTLELGIDIGDVDTVALLDPPPDVSALVQRIGRAGRRGARPKALLFAAGPAESFRYRTLLERAREGDLAADPPCFRPSVLVQQAISLLQQNPKKWITAAAFHSRLDAELGAAWPETRLEAVLSKLAERGWLEPAGRGRYVLGEETETRWRLGLLHSNLSVAQAVHVVDQLTGETVGTILRPSDDDLVDNAVDFVDDAADQAPARTLRLGGGSQRVVWEGERRILVRQGRGGAPPHFVPRGTPLVSRRLARAHARRLGLAEGIWPLVRARGRVFLFHFLGTAGGEVLGAALSDPASERGARRVLARGPLAIELASDESLEVEAYSHDALATLCRKRRKRLARVAAMGPYHTLLPADEADRSLFLVLDLEGLARIFARAQIGQAPRGHSDAFWEGLAARGPGRTDGSRRKMASRFERGGGP